MTLNTVDIQDLQVRYEKLRQNHLDGMGGYAMSIFQQEGMCGWLMEWMSSGADIGDSPQAQMKTNGGASKNTDGLVMLIASMTLNKLKGES